MPYTIKKDGDEFKVVNTASGKVKGTHPSHEKAEAQRRLLEGIEHGMTPRGRSVGRSRKGRSVGQMRARRAS